MDHQQTADTNLSGYYGETYGRGESLILKMGFQPGQGLGRNAQGISSPIEVEKRNGRGGFGFTSPSPNPNRGKARRTEADVAFDSVLYNPSKPPPSTRKQRESNSTPVSFSGGLEWIHNLSSMDSSRLTESGAKLSNGLKNGSGDPLRPDLAMNEWGPWEDSNYFRIQCWLNNMNLLGQRYEEDVSRNEQKLKFLRESEQALQKKLESLYNQMEDEKKRIKSTQDLIYLLHDLSNPEISHKEALDIFQNIKSNHYVEWTKFELYNLASIMAIPLILQKLDSWCLQDSVTEPLQMFLDWKILLSGYESAYVAIVWEAWMPWIRPWFEHWNVEDKHSNHCVVNSLECWKSAIPTCLLDNILNKFIVPNIIANVDSWDPLSIDMPLHAWLLPWIPFLETAFAVILPITKQKLETALLQWHPNSGSAKKVLIPCISMLCGGSSEAEDFILQHIIPRIQFALEGFILDGQTPSLEAWDWVEEWLDSISPELRLILIKMFQAIFFPKWLTYLSDWLLQSPTLLNVQSWYMSWGNVFPDMLKRDPETRDSFIKALAKISDYTNIHGVGGNNSGVDSTNIPENSLNVTHNPEILVHSSQADIVQVVSGFPNCPVVNLESEMSHIDLNDAEAEVRPTIATNHLEDEDQTTNAQTEIMMASLPGPSRLCLKLESTHVPQESQIDLSCDKSNGTNNAHPWENKTVVKVLPASSDVPSNFRDLVQKECEVRGILFVPLPKRSFDGSKVYRCGKVVISIVDGVIFVLNGAAAFPISLDDLLGRGPAQK